MGVIMQNGKPYSGSGNKASNISYDSTSSNSNASTVQSALDKAFDKFDKMNGVILVLLSTNWVEQEDGTFTNTIPYDKFSSEEVLEIDLYDDGNLSETKITEYEEYITEFNINNGEMVAVAKVAPTQTISVVVRGQFMADNVTIGNWEQIENGINQLETKNKVHVMTVRKDITLNAGQANGISYLEDIPSGTNVITIVFKGAYPLETWENAIVSELNSDDNTALHLTTLKTQGYHIKADILYTL